MNTNLLKLNRRNFFEHNEVNDLKLKVSNSGSTILLNNTNNDLIIELPFVDESDGLFFNFLISEVNSSKSITFFCAKDALGNPEQKLKIKNSDDVQAETKIIINTADTVRKWVGENMRVECNGSFWFLTALSFNESSNTNTLSNNSNFNVITATGTDELSGESNLTFNDTKLSVTGNISFNGEIESSKSLTNMNDNFLATRGNIYASNLKSLSFFENNWVQYGSDIDGINADDKLGSNVAMSADGKIIAVGSPSSSNSSGIIKVYKWNNTGWSQLGSSITGTSGVESGTSIDLTPDGRTLVITSIKFNGGSFTNNGSFTVFSWINNDWNTVGNLIFGKSSDEQLGHKCVINCNGKIVAVSTKSGGGGGADVPGTVRIYELINNTWTQRGSDLIGENNGDFFGSSIAINGAGDIIAIGAKLNDDNATESGKVRVYKWNGSIWQQLGSDIKGVAVNDMLGSSVDLSFDGLVLATGALQFDDTPLRNGYVSIYNYNGENWIKRGNDINGEAIGDESGSSISLSYDGKTVAIGSPFNDGNGANSGSVRVFNYHGDWIQIGSNINGESAGDEFGTSLGISSDGNTLISGSIAGAGYVRIFHLSEDLSNTAVKTISITPTIVSLSTANSPYTIDFSTINNVIYNVTFGGGNVLLNSSNATNVGQHGIIAFKKINNDGSLVLNTGQGWYGKNSFLGSQYCYLTYYIFEAGKIALLENETITLIN